MPNVLGYAEVRGGELRKVALETVSAARVLADALGSEAHMLLAGASGTAAHSAALGEHGADVVYVTEHAALAPYNPEALTALMGERARAGYAAVLVGASARGRDLAPRVAARLGTPILSDVTSLTVEGAALVATHPMYTGKVIA
ncbi:MAG: electron transfer flavoprotein subunit alpha/FixB family protein, partial [Gemmatimonadaceae bacterium]